MVKLFESLTINQDGYKVYTKKNKNIDVALQRYDEKYNCTLL